MQCATSSEPTSTANDETVRVDAAAKAELRAAALWYEEQRQGHSRYCSHA